MTIVADCDLRATDAEARVPCRGVGKLITVPIRSAPAPDAGPRTRLKAI
jgi:hypothetical protein